MAQGGDYEGALRAAESCIPLLRRLWAVHDLARAHNNAGDLSRQLGRRRKAVHHYRQALTWWKRIGDARGQALSLTGIGAAILDIEPDRAHDELRRARDLFVEAGDDAGLCETLTNLVQACCQIGRYAEACEHAEELVAVREKMGDAEKIAEALYVLGGVRFENGDLAASVAALRRADRAFETLGRDEKRVEVLEGLCEALAGQDLHTAAVDSLEQALALAASRRDGALECRLRNHLGIAQQRAGLLDPAGASLRQALDLVRHVPAAERPRQQADILMNLAQWSLSKEDYAHAGDYAARANGIFETLRDYPGSLSALRLRARAERRGSESS